MKISIITVCLNSEKTIIHTLNSVLVQNYKNIEHIIVDGGSTDGTIKIIENYTLKNKKIFINKGMSLYESLNFGIKKSKGKLISILHSDDIYNNKKILSRVVSRVKSSKSKIFFGNVVYFKDKDFKHITRSYPADNDLKKKFNFGNMPPHTGSFYKKEIFEQYGYYKKNFKIAGDFEHLLRIVFIKNIKYETLNFIVTRMKSGGLSGKNIRSFLTINNEILKSFSIHNINSNLLKILLRVPPKIFQYIFLNQNQLNKDFRFEVNKSYEDHYYNKLNIIRNIKKLNFNKNFILSALNLAFIGSLSKEQIKLNKNLINWPDGIFSKIYKKKLKKIPGREILKNLKINKKKIKRIFVLGNLSLNSKNYLKSKFKIKITHKKLPFGDIDKITKKLNLKLKSSDLVFLTLPTPKQEQLAEFLRKKNNHYKIICIGGSIGIVSGDEKEVPRSLYYFEFIWRLRYETFRRIKRLLITFYQYLSDTLYYKKINLVKVKIIN